jgi:poly(beta-D-mannuronate) lyase
MSNFMKRKFKRLLFLLFVMLFMVHGAYAADLFNNRLGCDEIPAPVDHLSGNSVYEKGDPTNSLVDKRAAEKYNHEMAPMWSFVKYVSKYASAYRASHNNAAANCALSALKMWSSAGALEHMDSRATKLNFGRNLSGVAFAYKKVREKASPEVRRIIDNWLHELAQSTSTVFDDDHTKTSKGNLRYWNGLGVAAVADLTNDDRLFKWGMDSFRIGVCQADNDGALPIEMARGRKALDYQNYATAALVMLADLSKKHGGSPAEVCNNALKKIVYFTVMSSFNPKMVLTKSHVRQAERPVRELVGSKYAWVKSYEYNFGAIIIKGSKVSVRQAVDPFLGGDVDN